MYDEEVWTMRNEPSVPLVSHHFTSLLGLQVLSTIAAHLPEAGYLLAHAVLTCEYVIVLSGDLHACSLYTVQCELCHVPEKTICEWRTPLSASSRPFAFRA